MGRPPRARWRRGCAAKTCHISSAALIVRVVAPSDPVPPGHVWPPPIPTYGSTSSPPVEQPPNETALGVDPLGRKLIEVPGLLT